MPRISEQELARLVKEAEWKGQMVTTLSTIADQAVAARNEAIALRKDCEDGLKRVSNLEGQLSTLRKSGMTSRDKAVVYASLITAIAAILTTVLNHFLH